MVVDSSLYSRKYTCPVCENEFSSMRVKTSALRPDKRDTDFCVFYKGQDPNHYAILVCPECGCSGFDSGFEDLTEDQKNQYRKNLKDRWSPRDFGGPRTAAEALEAHLLALATYQVIGVKKSLMGKLCMRIAWIYRFQEDPKEKVFLDFAVRNLTEAFSTERLDEDKENELMILFLLGEMNRRIGNFTDASKWFSMLLADPEVKKRRHLEIRAREQMSATREDFQKTKAQ